MPKKPPPPPPPDPSKPRPPTPREREEARILEELRPVAAIVGEMNACEKSLKRFEQAAWPVLSPGTPFQDNWHISAICEHMQALLKRDIRRLIISISPRSMKSKIISVAAPAWRWIFNPEEQFLCASYGRQLALDFSRQTRNLIKSPWYARRWGDKFSLSNDQNEKGAFENDKGGSRLAYSVEGGVLGRG